MTRPGRSPITDTEPRERADAARNRRAILHATEELLSLHGFEHVSLDKVAAAAGVGKGTVFRRFGNRTGLMRALLEDRALQLGEAIAATPAPLGTDAPADVRLAAFLEALADLAARNIVLLAAHDRACAQDKYADPTYLRWHAHVVELLAVSHPDSDADFVAHTLLGMFDADLVRHVVERGGPRRLDASVRSLCTTLLGARTR